MDAVGGVDLQAFVCAVADDFVDAGGAESGAWVVVFHRALGDADIGVGDVQVDGLVFVVLGGGKVYFCQTIARGEGALDVVFLRRPIFIDLFQRRPIRVILQRPRRQASGERFPAGVG